MVSISKLYRKVRSPEISSGRCVRVQSPSTDPLCCGTYGRYLVFHLQTSWRITHSTLSFYASMHMHSLKIDTELTFGIRSWSSKTVLNQLLDSHVWTPLRDVIWRDWWAEILLSRGWSLVTIWFARIWRARFSRPKPIEIYRKTNRVELFLAVLCCCCLLPLAAVPAPSDDKS